MKKKTSSQKQSIELSDTGKVTRKREAMVDCGGLFIIIIIILLLLLLFYYFLPKDLSIIS